MKLMDRNLKTFRWVNGHGCALQSATSENDAEKSRADRAVTAHQLVLAQLAAPEAHVRAGAVRLDAQATEIARLTQERDSLAEAATSAAEMRLENSALQERVALLSEQVACHDNLIVSLEDRHVREREAVRAHCEAAIAEERRKTAALQARLGWLGLQTSGTPTGERG